MTLRKVLEDILDRWLPKEINCSHCDRLTEFDYERDEMVDELKRIAELWQVKEEKQ